MGKWSGGTITLEKSLFPQVPLWLGDVSSLAEVWGEGEVNTWFRAQFISPPLPLLPLQGWSLLFNCGHLLISTLSLACLAYLALSDHSYTGCAHSVWSNLDKTLRIITCWHQIYLLYDHDLRLSVSAFRALIPQVGAYFTVPDKVPQCWRHKLNFSKFLIIPVSQIFCHSFLTPQDLRDEEQLEN